MCRRTWAVAVLCVLVAVVSARAEDTPEPTLTADESARLAGFVAESKAQFLGLLAGVSDAQWNFKPSPDRWSVGECAEHIMRSNEALLESAKQAMTSDPDPEWFEKTRGKAQMLIQVMPNRRPGGQGGATAPQEIRPTGEPSRQEIVERFVALFEELETLAKEAQDTAAPLKGYTTEHPFPIFNTLNAYDWMLYVPLHTIRHSRQMIEVMETEGYPSG